MSPSNMVEAVVPDFLLSVKRDGSRSHFVVLERATHSRRKSCQDTVMCVHFCYLEFGFCTRPGLSKITHHLQLLDMLQIVTVMSLSAMKYIIRHSFSFLIKYFT